MIAKWNIDFVSFVTAGSFNKIVIEKFGLDRTFGNSFAKPIKLYTILNYLRTKYILEQSQPNECRDTNKLNSIKMYDNPQFFNFFLFIKV